MISPEDVNLGDIETLHGGVLTPPGRYNDRASLVDAAGRTSRASAVIARLRALFKKHPRALIGVALFISSTVIGFVAVWLLAFAACQYTYSLPPTYTQPLVVPSYLNATFSGVTEYHVALLGDSLINHPYVRYDLPVLMSTFLPGLAVKWYNYGTDGDTIADMSDRVGAMLSVLLPTLDAVILLWDSDVSDHSGATHADRTSLQVGTFLCRFLSRLLLLFLLNPRSTPDSTLQAAFTANLNATLTTIFVRCPTCYVAVAGPGLLGEGPLFPPTDAPPLYYWSKGKMLDKYRSLTRRVCASLFVPYIDVRQVRFVFVAP